MRRTRSSIHHVGEMRHPRMPNSHGDDVTRSPRGPSASNLDETTSRIATYTEMEKAAAVITDVTCNNISSNLWNTRQTAIIWFVTQGHIASYISYRVVSSDNRVVA